MKLLIQILSTGLLAAILLPACKSTNESATKYGKEEPTAFTMARAPVIIYKTKNDYSRQVPVILNKEKNKVISYPAPADVYYRGKLAKPKQLQDGFLLDVRGIDKNAAFLSLTYEEYVGLEKTPTADSLLRLVLDPDPFTMIYRCGTRNEYDNLEAQLNLMITSGDLQKCTRLDQ